MRRIFSICLVVSSIFSANSHAVTNSILEQFKQFDRNEDGILSRAEAATDPALWSRFKQYDSDKDGKLSLSEFSHYLSK